AALECLPSIASLCIDDGPAAFSARDYGVIHGTPPAPYVADCGSLRLAPKLPPLGERDHPEPRRFVVWILVRHQVVATTRLQVYPEPEHWTGPRYRLEQAAT